MEVLKSLSQSATSERKRLQVRPVITPTGLWGLPCDSFTATDWVLTLSGAFGVAQEVEATERERQEQLLQRKLSTGKVTIDEAALSALDLEEVRRVQREAKVGCRHPSIGPLPSTPLPLPLLLTRASGRLRT